MAAPSTYEHVRPAAADYPAGVYRVVGAGDDAVTLLRVGDADGRRVTTGTVVTVGRDEFAGFTAAANPDGNRPLGATLAALPGDAYWSVRAFLRQLRARPVPTAAALALVVSGAAGERVVTLPDPAFGGAVLAGSLALAYVGSGRL